jgi:UPF0148 protein
VSKEITKKAVDMLLNGATLLGVPCPYCKGVRVMKDGYALCVSCGKEPEIEKSIPESSKEESIHKEDSTVMVLEQKLKKMSKELEQEKNHETQQEILKSINSIVEILNKLKK